MQIIPVIDLKDGVVVRGIGGRREEYKPIESQLTKSSWPVDVAHAFVRRGLTTIYIADLDAIGGRPAATDCYEQMRSVGASLWIDAGVNSVDGARQVSEWANQIVVGSETLAYFEELAELNRAFEDRLVFSLDLKHGKMLTHITTWQSLNPRDVARQVLDLGVRKLIVLDLASVGKFGGVGTEPLCREIRAYDSEVMLIGGGGVRGVEDLASLESAGCNAALVASALHDRRIVIANDPG